MTLTTSRVRKVLTAEQKKKKIEDAREYYAEVLQRNGAKPIEFNVKYPFQHAGTKVVGIFPNEFLKENGFYLELVDTNLDPVENPRKIYRVPMIENYEDVYELLPKGTYAFPMEELELVEQKILAPEFEVDTQILNKVKDENISNMTITDFAAIMWMKPVSEKSWLNNLIEQNITE